MQKDDIFSLIRLFLTPVLVIGLGLILIFNPDSASAFVSKMLGWILIAVGVIIGISVINHKTGQAAKGFGAVIIVVIGSWLVNNPLALAAWIGRIVGILLLVDGIQDIFRLRREGSTFLLPLIISVVGAVLVLMPMATSRIVFILCGIVVTVIGVTMLLDRLKGQRRLNSSGDDDIIDAL